MEYDFSNQAQLGKISENDWKESASVGIATEAFEESRKIKAYFTKQDKRPNLDGSLSLVENQEEVITVEVQIKTLPEDYSYKRANIYPYRYACDTKVFSVVIRRTTLNPVVLVLVDREKRLVFVKLLTEDYVRSLAINDEKTKTIGFSDEDILNVDRFISEVKSYRGEQKRKGYTTEMSMVVDVEAIGKELRRKKKHYQQIEHDNYKLVYTRDNIRGYLSNFFFDGENQYHMFMLKISDGIRKADTFKSKHSDSHESLEEEFIQVHLEKSIIIVGRPIQRTTATDEDVVNILYEIALQSKKILLYYSAGKPVYLIQGENGGRSCPILKLNAEEIEKEW